MKTETREILLIDGEYMTPVDIKDMSKEELMNIAESRLEKDEECLFDCGECEESDAQIFIKQAEKALGLDKMTKIEIDDEDIIEFLQSYKK